MHKILALFLIFSKIAQVFAEHVSFTYQFWEKDPEIAEKAEYYSRLAANSNRFWTSNLDYVQSNEKKDLIRISSENWKTSTVEEVVNGNLDQFFSQLFQKFAEKLFTNRALDTLPVFNPSVFMEYHYVWRDYVTPSENSLWSQLTREGTQQKSVYMLLMRKRTFEHWEALLHYVDAIQRAGLRGYIMECDTSDEDLCGYTSDEGKILLIAYRHEVAHKIYEGTYEKDNIFDWLRTIEQPTVQILTESMVPKFRSGIVPGFQETRETVTMLFIDTDQSQIWRNYLQYAKEVHGNYHLTAMISPEVKKWSIFPAFITMKPRDPFVKAFTLYKNLTYSRMVDFLEEGIHPSCHRISTPSSFLFSITHKPLLVFFDPLNTQNITKFKMAASQEQTKERMVQYAAVTGFDLLGMYMMSVFNVETAHYVLVQRLKKSWCIQMRPIDDGDSEKLEDWLLDLNYSLCQVTVEDFKFPISRLHLLERYDDVEELEKDLTAVHRDRDEL